MNITNENSRRLIVTFNEGEDKPHYIKHFDGHNNRRLYHFECGHCGVDYYARKSDAGNVCSKSCSASLHKTDNLQSNNRLDEYSPFRQYLAMANRRKHECTLTLEYLKRLWDEQQGICPYTKHEMVLPKTTMDYQKVGHVWNKASIDRIDSTKGYIEGNVQFVSMSMNFAKNSMDESQILQMIQAIKNN